MTATFREHTEQMVKLVDLFLFLVCSHFFSLFQTVSLAQLTDTAVLTLDTGLLSDYLRVKQHFDSDLHAVKHQRRFEIFISEFYYLISLNFLNVAY